jgi:cytosine deaminase
VILPYSLTLLRSATLPDGRVVDVEIDGDTVQRILPAGDAAPTSAELDLAGFMLLTATADPHSHLDKARSWDAIRPPMGDLRSAIDAWRDYTVSMTETDVASRARTQVLAMLRQGTTAIRSHVNLLSGEDPLLSARALITVRNELADLVDLELVVFPDPETPDAHVEAALDLGLDLVGGTPHLAANPSADLQRLLAIAKLRGLGVDMHTDESLDGAITLGELARTVRGWTQNVSAGHCVRLGTLPPTERDDLIAEVVASRIGVIANPITNLYLQGWAHESSVPRGLTAVRELIDAGARFAAGADNVRDPFNPLGRSDALETAMLLVAAGHLNIEEAVTAVSGGARDVMGLPAAGAVEGARAEFLAVRGTSLADVVADAPADRYVVHAGQLVSFTRVTNQTAPAATPLLRKT